jgi:hypothetical protein
MTLAKKKLGQNYRGIQDASKLDPEICFGNDAGPH